jgi:hypothetical protein
MNSTAKRLIRTLAAGAAVGAWLLAVPAHAVLKHQYTFNNGTANDSVGTSHGTVVDAGTPTAAFTLSGQLDFSANTGQGSNAITQDAYLDLPNGLISQTAAGGGNNAISFEFWATVVTQRTWQRFGDFGTSDGGENTSPGGGGVNYMLISPNSGRFADGLEMTNHIAGAEPNVGLTGPFPVGTEQYVAAVYDKNNTAAGPGGTMSLYLNGGLIGTGIIDPLFDLTTLNDNNNWLGRSQWPDPVFDGTFNEFRIYDHALTQAEVTTHNNEGPVPVPLPSLIVNKTTGAAVIRNLSNSPIKLDYYEIESPDADGPGGTPGGALSTTGWNSLSDQNLDAGLGADFNNSATVNDADLTVWKGGFGTGTTKAQGNADGDGDVDGNDFLTWQRQVGKLPGEGDSWDEAGGSSNIKVAELFLNGGTTLAPGAQVSLGNVFNPAVFGAGVNGNLIFRFGVKGEASLTPSVVTYVTSGPAVGVPEPATTGLAGAALGGLWAARRRRGSK